MIHKKVLFKTVLPTALFLFLSLISGFGQEILPKEKEREIKTSGKYFYGEYSAFDEAEAKECALKDLTQAVIIDMIQRAIKSDETEMQSAMEMRAQTARLNLTGRIRVLAWIEKENVAAKPEATATTASEAGILTGETGETEPVASPKPDYSTISNPVARDLATCETFDQFRRMADGFRRQGKLIYGTNKASFSDIEKCFAAVFTSKQKLIALLDAGQTTRTDLLTGNAIANIERQFPAGIIYWIQINN
jgi:hypothetical protein